MSTPNQESLVNRYVAHMNAKRILLVARDCPDPQRYRLPDDVHVAVSARADVQQASLDVELVIMVDDTLPEARLSHRACFLFKEAGLPVVFGDARPIFTTLPTQYATGINYGGMFRLAADYLSPIRSMQPARAFSYVEFGVYDGRTVTLAYLCFQHLIKNFYACDTFEGIRGTMPSEVRQFQEGTYYANETTFHLNMRMVGADPERIHTIKDDFRDITHDDMRLPPSDSVAVAHIDCDVYAAAKAALDLLSDRLIDGALVLFDDYDSLLGNPNNGERRASREWLEENPSFRLDPYRCYSSTCRAFIFYRVQVKEI